METLIQIGMYFLYFVTGALFCNVLLHLNWSFSFEKLSEKHKNSLMGSHLGNAVLGIVYLFIGLLILALLKYQFGLNLNTLFLFIGFALVAFNFGIRFDRKEKKQV